MAKIKEIIAREILDSRGNPTVECDLWLDNGIMTRAGVPSGASTGSHEALELRDDDKSRYLGKGVKKAVDNVNKTIAPKLKGMDVDYKKCDGIMLEMDGTKMKNKLGANAILSVSLAVVKAQAALETLSLWKFINKHEFSGATPKLPVPMMNIMNGGQHADTNVEIQEFMVVPAGFDSFHEALRAGAEVFHNLKKVLKKDKLATSVGDEGGFAPNLPSNETALKYIMKAIEEAGYKPGKQVFIALDSAASEFYADGKYTVDGKQHTPTEMKDYYVDLCNKYPIVSIEDGFFEDDWDGWKAMTDAMGKKIQLVGDDLFVTNVERLQRGIDNHTANAILIKVNQIGSFTETMSAIQLGYKHNYNSIISHRSGETCDSTISDIAVATGRGQIKTGSLCRSERIEKYNQLLRIEEEMTRTGMKPVYMGHDLLKSWHK